MKKCACLLLLLPAVSLAGVIMVPDSLDPDITLQVGETLEIAFMTDVPDFPFYGVVEWVGEGYLSQPRYPGDPIIILPDPPYYPGFLPDNMWPVYHDPFLSVPTGLIAWTTYYADEAGNAAINLYDLGLDFSEFTLIDSFDIVIIPEPMTAALLALGALFIKRR